MEKQFWITLFTDEGDNTLKSITDTFLSQEINIQQMSAKESLIPSLMQYDILVNLNPSAIKALQKGLSKLNTVHKALSYEPKEKSSSNTREKIKVALKAVVRKKQMIPMLSAS
ncbi:hypothetical protein [Persicobacter diffluens]|uniref:ACT domain-containing protein n=1 Tax=Persicobacter diffluens TaxID=981 RepID=A0AAN4VZ55_9BACT|nr:hypothetical protein PEDI_21750 [Persicobacter diffluens]